MCKTLVTRRVATKQNGLVEVSVCGFETANYPLSMLFILGKHLERSFYELIHFI